ncbi:cytochrome P450 [Artemisia annua]|uniref:Cytochrome P450 n=1 Tax=Artemisia annua TaxID=35608 RepID=A0A2U1KLY1_ARTAN|nr:cytochrome P450 [Artemisia annua]
MEIWFVIVVTICLAALIRAILFSWRTGKKLPPGPSFLYSTYLILTNSVYDFEPILIRLKAIYGPLITLPIGFNPSFFVGSHSLAHEILIQKGALFSDRPKTIPVLRISTSPYGPTWRILRRNLTSEIMHPYRIKSSSWARKWVLCNLIDKIQEHAAAAADGIMVIDHFQHAMFSLLACMCFGQKFDEGRISEIAKVACYVFPRLRKILFRKSWKEFERVSNNNEQVFIPIIKSRIESANSEKQNVAYVDTLVNIQLPQEEADNRNSGKLTFKDMVDLCGEFFNAGTETTTTSLHWIMANLVKFPHIQSKLYDEIVAVVGPPPPLPQKKEHAAAAADGIMVIDHFQHAMFSLLACMCFGQKFDEGRISEIAKVHRDMQMMIGRFRLLAMFMFPRLRKILFRKSWKEFERVSNNNEQVFIPIIKSRIESANSEKQNVAYVDTLVNIQLPQEEADNRNSGKLTFKDMVDLCGEFFNAGTETTTTSLHWIMANLVKFPHIQSKLYDEIVAVVGPPPPLPQKKVELESVISEEDLKKMPYLKAVVLEGLRRHPPAHFVLPHSVTKEAEVQGYTIPQGATISFLVGEMGLDPKLALAMHNNNTHPLYDSTAIICVSKAGTPNDKYFSRKTSRNYLPCYSNFEAE